jgi:hypothetical protein
VDLLVTGPGWGGRCAADCAAAEGVWGGHGRGRCGK